MGVIYEDVESENIPDTRGKTNQSSFFSMVQEKKLYLSSRLVLRIRNKEWEKYQVFGHINAGGGGGGGGG